VADAWAYAAAAGERALTALKQTREALSAVLPALLSPSRPGSADGAADGAAPELEHLLADLGGRREQVAAGTRPGRPGGSPAERRIIPALLIPDRVAHAAVDLPCHVDLSYLGMCPVEDGGCGWIFIDRSRNRSRRWRSMEDCGTHAKARRLTQRRRVARSSYQQST
jgi:predicted RNA-binding Zn ribbon-like protein